MNTSHLQPFVNPRATTWAPATPIASARAFHRTMNGYQPTPLVELPQLATELNAGRVFLKDESQRLGLPAFKILGASWAVANGLAEKFGIPVQDVSLDKLRAAIGAHEVTLVTATDGNHGRAVSHLARMLGIRARVYTPKGVSDAAIAGIRSEGAELIESDSIYDDVVLAASASVVGHDNELLIQDTSWPGYEAVPRWIVEGYTTLFSEIDEQLAAISVAPDVVVIPTGVGSLIQSAIEYYRGTSAHRPAILCVEPVTAACVLESLHAGALRSVDTSAGTIMTGLCTGSVSELAWPSLHAGLDAAVAVTDDDARRAVADLETLGVDSGPCGASTLAGTRKFFADQQTPVELSLPESPVVVLLGTEGRAANPFTP